MSTAPRFSYEYSTRDADYIDHEFTDGDPCKLFLVTYSLDDGTWSGIIQTTETPGGPLDAQDEMSDDMLNELRSLIPAEPRAWESS